MALIAGPKEKACIFCSKPREGDARESLVLAVTRTSVVMLNKYPYNNAHLLISPRRHVADLERLSPGERVELSETLGESIRILKRTLGPQGMNLGMNLGAVAGAGVADHLHWHVVPRWAGDTNFMSVLASTRVMPEHLLETYDRLHPEFASLRRRRTRVAPRGGHPL